jgi:hypothetical protein
MTCDRQNDEYFTICHEIGSVFLVGGQSAGLGILVAWKWSRRVRGIWTVRKEMSWDAEEAKTANRALEKELITDNSWDESESVENGPRESDLRQS